MGTVEASKLAEGKLVTLPWRNNPWATTSGHGEEQSSPQNALLPMLILLIPLALPLCSAPCPHPDVLPCPSLSLRTPLLSARVLHPCTPPWRFSINTLRGTPHKDSVPSFRVLKAEIALRAEITRHSWDVPVPQDIFLKALLWEGRGVLPPPPAATGDHL